MKASQATSITRKHNFRAAKVLIIDDNLDHVALMKQLMEHCLPEVQPVTVRNQEEALAYLSNCAHQEWKLPKLILLDLYLPQREDGWRILKQIKEMAAPINFIPVVLLSNSNSKEDIGEAYDRGGASYIVKPLTSADWLTHFQQLRSYWWETVSLPQPGYRL